MKCKKCGQVIDSSYPVLEEMGLCAKCDENLNYGFTAEELEENDNADNIYDANDNHDITDHIDEITVKLDNLIDYCFGV